MTNEYELYLEASTRGYHAYFKDATVYIGEILITGHPSITFEYY